MRLCHECEVQFKDPYGRQPNYTAAEISGTLTPDADCANLGSEGSLPMVRADSAKVEWNAEKKRWEVHIQVGAEVVKRPVPKPVAESGGAALKEAAIATARDEGYEIDPANVAIEETSGHLA